METIEQLENRLEKEVKLGYMTMDEADREYAIESKRIRMMEEDIDQQGVSNNLDEDYISPDGLPF